MSHPIAHQDLLASLNGLNEHQLRSLLVKHLTERKLGLRWEADLIERDAGINVDQVLPRLVPEWSHRPEAMADGTPHANLIIEGDNFDALRLLRATHAGKIRVIYIDPPYNTGNKDWVYNDHYVGANDRWRHSQWLEFLYRRLTLARDLLTSDGVILVSINDDNRARLELLMDEVFPGRRVGSLVWKKRRASNAAGVEHFFSTDHEHILVYAGQDFAFLGSGKDWSKYNQWDEAANDWWTSTQLTLGFNKEQRKNLFYPLHNPSNDIWYPCDPNRVWARATEVRLEGKGVRTESMEALIAKNGVHFPEEQSPVRFSSIDELQRSISDGTAPPHLATQHDLAFWVNKKIGYGKPRFKTYRSKVRTESQPLSSVIVESGKEQTEVDSERGLISSGLTSEGTRVLREMDLGEEFPYPKPLSLIKNLLKQATRSDDIVLDFFAGSSTVAHAVLALNEEDDSSRRFILCSNTEANEKEPNKNLCRDVCAARVRRVITGYGEKPGCGLEHGGEFAYLQLDRIAPADLPFDLDTAQAFQWLSLQRFGVAQSVPQISILHVGRIADCDILICDKVDQNTVDQLVARTASNDAYRFAVYCSRPDTLREALASRGIEANTYSLLDTLLAGGGA